MHLVSIDIGIVNLGYMSCTLAEDGDIGEIHVAKRCDITKMRHDKVPACECVLQHDSCVADYVSHFVQEHRDEFQRCDKILIERQPLVGLQGVEQCLLLLLERSKVQLISPNMLHSHFCLSTCYENRKEQSMHHFIEFAMERNINTSMYADRLHDISDAFLMIQWFSDCERQKKKNNTLAIPFEQFVYKRR